MAIEAITGALKSGDLVTAEALCADALGRDPDHPEVLLLHALVLQRQGRDDDALQVYRRLVELQPGDPLHARNLAVALAAHGDLAAAETTCRSALERMPRDAGLLEQLGLLQLQQRKPTEARDTLLRAFGVAPDDVSIRIHAARACVLCRDYRADDLTKAWPSWLPLEDDLQFELADLKAQSGDALSALELLEQLVPRAPGFVSAALLLASVYERVNRVADAEATLDAIVTRETPLGIELACEIAHQRAQLALHAGDHEACRAILENVGPRNTDDYMHFRLLAQACDKLGDHAAAMRHLRTMHDRQSRELRLATPHRFEPGAPLMPAAVARVSAAEYGAWPSLQSPDQSQSPIFIVGFPRSGTTLLEQMLDAHPRLQSMDERPFFNILATQLSNVGVRVPQDLGRLDQRDCDELRKGYLLMACSKVPRRWDTRLVDKNPLNMLWLPMIQRLYPQAKFILALRHPCDVLLSCYMQDFRSAVLAVACETLGKLAEAYVAAMDCWLHHVDVMQPEVFVSRYEDLVADTPAQTRRIAAFLGLEDSEAMLQFDARAREKGFIATPSYTQVIQPINRKGIGRWEHYREYFEPVLPVLRPLLDHWGYST